MSFITCLTPVNGDFVSLRVTDPIPLDDSNAILVQSSKKKHRKKQIEMHCNYKC